MSEEEKAGSVDKTTPKPWPMKWVVYAALVYAVIYLAVNLWA